MTSPHVKATVSACVGLHSALLMGYMWIDTYDLPSNAYRDWYKETKPRFWYPYYEHMIGWLIEEAEIIGVDEDDDSFWDKVNVDEDEIGDYFENEFLSLGANSEETYHVPAAACYYAIYCLWMIKVFKKFRAVLEAGEEWDKTYLQFYRESEAKFEQFSTSVSASVNSIRGQLRPDIWQSLESLADDYADQWLIRWLIKFSWR